MKDIYAHWRDWFVHVETFVMDEDLNVFKVADRQLDIIRTIEWARERGLTFPLVGFWVDKRDNQSFRVWWMKEGYTNYGPFTS